MSSSMMAGKRLDEGKKSGVKLHFLENLNMRGPSSASTSTSAPKDKAYASISILEPIITIERHHEKYHIAARFNLETTILNYENPKRDGREYFFQDICLQYLSPGPVTGEELFMRPESDPSAAMAVTRGTEIGVSGDVGLSAQSTPSANVSLGLSRSKTLNVEYALATWSLSAHHVVHASTAAPPALAAPMTADPGPKREPLKPTYQWFWAGTHEQTKVLTPDLKQTVKRHVVARRSVPISTFPILGSDMTPTKAGDKRTEAKTQILADNTTTASTGSERGGRGGAASTTVEDAITGPADQQRKKELETLQGLLSFSFCVQIRVKKRFGRLHRNLILSSSEVKGKLVKPVYQETFELRAEPDLANPPVPRADTPNINELLQKAKKEYQGQYDALEGKDFFEDIAQGEVVTQTRTVSAPYITRPQWSGRQDRQVFTTYR